MSLVGRTAFAVFSIGWLLNVPAAALNAHFGSESLLYDILTLFAAALGIALFPLVFGMIVVFAARAKPGQGMKPAVIVTAVLSGIVYFAMWRMSNLVAN